MWWVHVTGAGLMLDARLGWSLTYLLGFDVHVYFFQVGRLPRWDATGTIAADSKMWLPSDFRATKSMSVMRRNSGSESVANSPNCGFIVSGIDR